MVPKVIHAWFVVMLFDPVADQNRLSASFASNPSATLWWWRSTANPAKITLAAWAQCTWIKVVQIPIANQWGHVG